MRKWLYGAILIDEFQRLGGACRRTAPFVRTQGFRGSPAHHKTWRRKVLNWQSEVQGGNRPDVAPIRSPVWWGNLSYPLLA